MAEGRPIVDEVGPETVYEILESDPSANIVDVRTRAEWTFVGVPDLSALGRRVLKIEWISYPDMAHNRHFLEQLLGRLEGKASTRLFFLCRSGSRSLEAARLVASAMAAEGRTVHCTNIAGGFEGDIDGDGRRGTVNGWKACGLPWRQN